MVNLDEVESENNKSSNNLPSIPEDDNPNPGYINDHWVVGRLGHNPQKGPKEGSAS